MVRRIDRVLLVIVLALFRSSSADNYYCNLRSCNGLPHTACMFSRSFWSNICGRSNNQIIESGLTKEEKQKILNLHNELRQKVANGKETRGSPGPQPAANSMPLMEWDDELASIAQKWANQCKWGHDTCRDVKRFKVGQNIAYLATTGNVHDLKVEDMVQMWYNEVQYLNRNDVIRFSNRGANGKAIGHYTQLIWAQSTKIGCGAIKYKDEDFKKFFLVCNYGPAGNILGQPIYEIR